jgi:hypothetical protein
LRRGRDLSQVQTHTIGCLERINEEEPLILQHNLMQIVVPAVLGAAASTNKYGSFVSLFPVVPWGFKSIFIISLLG